MGGILGGIPGAVSGYVAERVANSPLFLSGASKGMQLAAKGLNTSIPIPNLVQKGAKAAYISGRVGRVANPFSSEQKVSQPGVQGQVQSKPPAVQKSRFQKVASTYPSSITGSQFSKTTPSITKEIKYTNPKNIFKNKSAFGRKFTLGGS